MNKYNSKITFYNGQKFHSKKEAEHAKKLDLLIKAKKIKSYSRQHKIPISINGHHICNYIVDFVILKKDNTKELHEVKGFMTPVAKIKIKMAEATLGCKIIVF